ncbi:MAG TPA: serine/threonine-protein kinase, partial [Gemmatimonadaceae bacterium]|nr:serine/threonine-protein kinase [Gemmatimonadaceae bacterium]
MSRHRGDARGDAEGRALRLLDGALQRPDGERHEWLARQCEGDTTLMDAVLALLDACERADHDRFLADPADALGTSVAQSVLAQEAALASDTVAIVAAALDGRYAFVRELGVGGAASVHLARDLRHNRDVAIKIIQQSFGGAHLRERFRTEIAIEAQLRHPYIVPLLDSGEANGIPYYVMPFIDGESLHQRLERHGVLPLDEVLAVARDVAEALDCAHRHGVIHRDIKPRNILLLQGHALVADFGIALALRLSDDVRVTTQGMAVGTPAYMSPEQALSAGQVDARSDVYSLGCVVYEMLTGEVPYPGTTPQAIVAKHISAPVPDVAVLRPQLPAGVCEAVRTALAKHPADRFASAGAFVKALQEGAAHAATARPDANVPPPRTPTDVVAAHAASASPANASARDAPDRRRTRLTVAAALVLALGAAAVVTTRVRNAGRAGRLAPDTTRYVVFPLFRTDSTVRDLTPQVRDAAARWGGVQLLDADPGGGSGGRAPGRATPASALEASRRASAAGA